MDAVLAQAVGSIVRYEFDTVEEAQQGRRRLAANQGMEGKRRYGRKFVGRLRGNVLFVRIDPFPAPGEGG